MRPSPSNQTLQTICQAVIATAVVTYMVYWLRPVLVPFVVALLVVSGVTPILQLMERTLRVNRLTAAVIAFVTGLLLLAALCVCLWISVRQIEEEGQAYRARVSELVLVVQGWMPNSVLDPSNSSDQEQNLEEQNPGEQGGAPIEGGIPPTGENELKSDLSDEASSGNDSGQIIGTANVDDSDADAVAEGELAMPAPAGTLPDPQPLPAAYVGNLREMADGFIRTGLTRLSAELFSIFSTSVVVLIYVFFLLLGSAETSGSLASVKAVDQQVRSYLFLKTIISVLTGVCFGAALWVFGVPMSLTFGMLAFLLNYIPNVGPVVASLLPIPFILLDPDGGIIWMLAAISITMTIQVVSGNVVEPMLMGDSSDLHPVVILLALMFWGMMWGITGMFLATPITAGLKIVLEGNQATKPFAEILAGRFGALRQDTLKF